MLTDKEGLWYRVLKARYGESGERLQEGGRTDSYWWRKLCRVREGVGEGVGRLFVENTRRFLVMVEILCSGTIRGWGKYL
jgi:hypothetical protein